jgi:hypothetical protein
MSNSQSNSEQKSNAGGFIICNFKLYYRAIIIKKKERMILAQRQTGRPVD